jgi:hypothetical protein
VTTLEALRQLQTDLITLKASVRGEASSTINKMGIRKEAERVGSKWFQEVRPLVNGSTVVGDVLDRYSRAFQRLIKISAPSNLRSSYLETLDALTKRFRAELILPLQTAPAPAPQATSFDALFAALSDSEEDVYLMEAIACAKHGFLRAAAVLGWCAVVDRMHRTVERIGFAKFNVTSASRASQQQGRFKRFNKPQNIASISELRMVFDSDLIWILEGMQLIDSNQHTRLHSCFELRNHSGHPGAAPVTEYNLLSFFSDLIEIVLKNPTFQ